MSNTKTISYDPDGAQMVNDSAGSIWYKFKNSKLGKWFKRCGKFIKREGAARPLWKVVFGFILLWALAVVSGFYKYGVQKLLFGTVQTIWNLLLSVTVGAIIKGASENRKVK